MQIKSENMRKVLVVEKSPNQPNSMTDECTGVAKEWGRDKQTRGGHMRVTKGILQTFAIPITVIGTST